MSDTTLDDSVHVSASSNGRAIALPETVADLLAQKKSGHKKTLNDFVETLHLELWENPDYRRFLDATSNSDSREGSLIADDMMAVQMLRAYAKDKGNRLIAGKNLATLRTALHVVLRRYGIGRKERLDSIHVSEFESE